MHTSKWFQSSIWPIDGTLKVLPLQVRANLGAMAISQSSFMFLKFYYSSLILEKHLMFKNLKKYLHISHSYV